MKYIIRDKTGRPIHEGDVIKLFHFVGARNKKHYMYKSITIRNERLFALHLTKLYPGEPVGFYIHKDHLDKNGLWIDCEVVQSSVDGYSK